MVKVRLFRNRRTPTIGWSTWRSGPYPMRHVLIELLWVMVYVRWLEV